MFNLISIMRKEMLTSLHRIHSNKKLFLSNTDDPFHIAQSIPRYLAL